MGACMELEGLVVESEGDRVQQYSDFDFLMQIKQNADIYYDNIYSEERRIDTVLLHWRLISKHDGT